MQESFNTRGKTQIGPALHAEPEPPEIRDAMQVSAAKSASAAFESRVDKQKAFADSLRSGRFPDFDSI